jgi:hypothetical protein
MVRRFVGLALIVGGLACAQTTRIVQFRSGWTTDQTEVSQLGPGHYGGRWTNHSVEFYDPGHTDEETFVCTESGVLDLVYSGPYTVSTCTSKSTKVCRHPDGTTTWECAATCLPGPDGLLVFEGGASLVGATGRFEGTKARGTFTAWQVIPGPHDYGYTQGTVEMTLPKK